MRWYTHKDMKRVQDSGQEDWFISGDWCEYCGESVAVAHFHKDWKYNGVGRKSAVNKKE